MENIFGLCVNWLTDNVYAIREAACKLMKRLHDIFKGDEFEKKLLEKLIEMRTNSSYLIRNTTLILAKVGDIKYYILFLSYNYLHIILISIGIRKWGIRF